MITDKNVRPFSCPSCGGGLEIKNPKSKFVNCPYCGATTDITDITGKVISKPENFTPVPPMSFLQLGMTGTFDGKKYHIIGRTSWRADYEEYWSEEGSTGYSSEIWNYDDWLLIGEDGTYINIIEDREGYSINKKIIPKYPTLPDATVMENFFKKNQQMAEQDIGVSMRVREYGNNTIKYYEGESTYLVNVGDSVRFSEYHEGGNSYIAEWRFNADESVKELEFFEEKKISKADLQDCFRSKEELEARQKELEDKNKVRTLNKRIFQLAAAVNLVLAILIGMSSSSYKTVLNEKFKVKEAETSSKVMPSGAITSADSLMQYTKSSSNILEISEKDKLLKLKMTPTSFSNGEATMHVIMTDPEGREVFHVGEYYFNNPTTKVKFESPYNETFKVDKAGKYNVKMMFEIPAKDASLYANNVAADLEIKTSGTQRNYGMFVFMAIILFVISLFIRKKKRL